MFTCLSAGFDNMYIRIYCVISDEICLCKFSFLTLLLSDQQVGFSQSYFFFKSVHDGGRRSL